uniref:Putative LRR receptor-like serine/threonine-protein kinase GSO2 n=1 Tax=Davidia involucrata TaxID=16924 RepID=A0A5B6ZVI5_DAVIN
MIMGNSIARVVLLLLWFLYAATFKFSSLCNGDTNVICSEKEKRALLSFKQGLTDPNTNLLSWSPRQEDCCRWNGVRCSNATGRVIELHLRDFNLGGKIPPSLIELEFLTYLDLRWNDFEGPIPHQLGNISSLRYLDLGGNQYQLYVDSLSWIARLYSLEYLDMNGVHLHKAADHWFQAVSMLPSLSELHLSECRLDKMMIPPPPGFVNFTSLAVLDLSANPFGCEIPSWLFNLTSNLSFLDLSEDHLTGQIPDWIGQMKHLEYLSLDINSLYGPIPAPLGNLSSLSGLYLSLNQLNGTLPESLGLLPNLMYLGIEYNSLTGIISEMNFIKLSKLKALEMSSNSFIFNVNSNWVPPFQLEYISISSCKIGPKFPAWLKTQTSVKLFLFLSGSGISDSIPDWFWNMASHIESIDLSNNQIDGDVSTVLLNSSAIDLSSNCFKGQLPLVSPNVKVLNIANNTFSGSISSFLCRKVNRNNNLEVLDVSSNSLSGELSDCWMYWGSLNHINLGSNNLSGKIPNSMGYLSQLHSLHLHDNSFFGDIPSSLQNCTSLGLIDLGENQLTGVIPSWIGERTTLNALRLKSNKFTGNIPPQICQLSYILVLDLANNSLSGTIPKCLNNISAMTVTDTSNFDPYYEALEYDYDGGSYMETLWLVTKRRDSEYRDILALVRIIDLSSNSLSGPIPAEISGLHALRFLNLSRNHLTGKIPDQIGGMTTMESLDLSRNHLSGQIPQSMSNLTFLNYLDLSYNKFSGRIPLSTQLQSFNETSFIGNAQLCGAPLTKNCTEEEQSQGTVPPREDKEESEMFWFYIGLGPGFSVGFWGVCGVLFLKRTWRHAYFQFLDDMKDWVYVATLLKVNWLRKKFERSSTHV